MSLGESLSLGFPGRGYGSKMEVGLKISVLFSNSKRKVKNVPKYMLRVVSTYLYGRRIDWRRIFSSFIIEVLDPSWRVDILRPICAPVQCRPGLYARTTDDEKAENRITLLALLCRSREVALSNADRKSRGLLNSLYGVPKSLYGAHHILGEVRVEGTEENEREELAKMRAQCRANGLWNVKRLKKEELAHLLMTI